MIPLELMSLLAGEDNTYGSQQQAKKLRRRMIFSMLFYVSLGTAAVVSLLPVLVDTGVTLTEWGICYFADESPISLAVRLAVTLGLLLSSLVAFGLLLCRSAYTLLSIDYFRHKK